MLSFVRLFVLLCLSVAVVGVQAQAWPAKTIRVVVNFPAGGTTDMMARAWTQKLSEVLGQPVIIENRGGAGGNVGLEVAARAAPDGYTLLASSGSPIVVGPHLYKLSVDVGRDLDREVPEPLLDRELHVAERALEQGSVLVDGESLGRTAETRGGLDDVEARGGDVPRVHQVGVGKAEGGGGAGDVAGDRRGGVGTRQGGDRCLGHVPTVPREATAGYCAGGLAVMRAAHSLRRP